MPPNAPKIASWVREAPLKLQVVMAWSAFFRSEQKQYRVEKEKKTERQASCRKQIPRFKLAIGSDVAVILLQGRFEVPRTYCLSSELSELYTVYRGGR